MKQIRIPIKGIERNSPQGIGVGCDDMINMRFIKNAWRPLAPKVTLHPENDYKPQRIHTDDGIDNWIGYLASARAIEYFDPDTLAVIQSILTLNGVEELNDILFLKRMLIVLTDENSYKFYFKDGAYQSISLIGIEDMILVNRFPGLNYSTIYTELASDAAGLLSKYYKLVNEASEKGYLHGGFYYRTAFKMFDGNFIMHSSPIYHQFAQHYMKLRHDSA
jgi:hypothetical protein